MIEKLTRLYEGEPLSGVNSAVLFIPVEFDFEIQKIKVKLEETVAADVVFALTNSDGTTTAGTTLTITTGNDSAILDGLTIARLEDADINLKLISGAVNSTITLTLTVDDGETGAEITDTDDLAEGAANKYFTAARVLAVVATGISFATNSAALATDTLLVIFGKLQAQITDRVIKNAGITGATKTKITYDAKGLVTAGSDATASDVGLGNVTNDAQLKRAAGDIATFTEKTTPAAADLLLIEDSAASGAKKKVQISNLPSSGSVSGTSGKIAKFTSSSVVDSNLSDDGSDITANDKTLSRFSAKVNDQTGTTYTLNATDNGKIVTCSNASAITVTIPSTLGLGFSCVIYQKGAGQVTVAAGAGATLRNPNPTAKTRAVFDGDRFQRRRLGIRPCRRHRAKLRK